MAPNYANLFMSNFEDKFIGTRPIHYRRYIDDLLFVWTHMEVELVEYLNNSHPTINYSSRVRTETDVTFVTSLDSIAAARQQRTFVKLYVRSSYSF